MYTFPASTTAESISVPVGITDDDVGLEEPEVYRLLLTDVDQRVTLGGDDLFTTTLITIEDDDGEEERKEEREGGERGREGREGRKEGGREGERDNKMKGRGRAIESK